MARSKVTIDGNEAAARVAFPLSEVIAIYPITPSSPMGEWADEWSAGGRANLWGTVPLVVEMQSEGGAAGTVHGALQTGSLTCTFTASQGLLLMIPNMFKIAGELTPTVFHVSARTVATHALSIFGDHSDVMAARSTGWAMLCANSVQEIMDFALISTAATLRSRVPFVHFFDGFRSSHEVQKIEALADADLRAMIDDELVREHRMRALSPDRPVLRGSAQNPDVFFQAREACNPYYAACAEIVAQTMARFAQVVGRQYRLFDYVGAPDADRVIVMMGSGAEAAHETVEHLTARGEKVGLVKVRLYRPFSTKHLLAALPRTVRRIAVLDRTKEPGAIGEPLYLDVVAALSGVEAEEAGFGQRPTVVGGRYGLSSKEFTAAMAKAVYDALGGERPRHGFTVGIEDDVTHLSLPVDAAFSVEADDVFRGVFYGLGSDGTVGANKNSIKIIGEGTENYAQGYFVYDSKKSGSVTVSHLRFGPRPIRSTYLVSRADFVACHQFGLLETLDVLAAAREGATFLLNSPYGAEEVWERLPREVQQQVVARRLRMYVINGDRVAAEAGMTGRVNTVMQACFFAISGVLPREEAIEAIKGAIRKTYGNKGEQVVAQNCRAVDMALENLHEVVVPKGLNGARPRAAVVSAEAPEFMQRVAGPIIAGRGDEVPVSLMPVDGTFPTGTARWEKRSIADEIPVWDEAVCIQCGKCAIVCPHAAIRAKVYEPQWLANAPRTFKSVEARGGEFKGMRFSLQTAPEDCTGCGVCVEVCPAKNKSETRLKAINMRPQRPLREQERENYDFFLELPEYDRRKLKLDSVKGSQLALPLFEYSGACAGCGETPYLKLLSQLFGDRALIANATGCSSIYGGNLPTTPWAQNREGRGPAWSNSLFEDNAEFGYGFRLSLDKQIEAARELVSRLRGMIGDELADALLTADQRDEAGIHAQRARVHDLRSRIAGRGDGEIKDLLSLADALVRKSVWIVGGDGWAYDIGYGGLDHVLAQGRNVNVLVLDTEVYSNTGGQASKATPRAGVAKFAFGGKAMPKKDLALAAMSYGHVYVARVALGADDNQCVKAFIEAEAYDGPSLIIAYSHCIAHGIDMRRGMAEQKLAVEAGHWPLLRYNPARIAEGKNPLTLDSKAPQVAYGKFAANENRFRMLSRTNPAQAEKLLALAQEDARARHRLYQQYAAMLEPPKERGTDAPATAEPIGSGK